MYTSINTQKIEMQEETPWNTKAKERKTHLSNAKPVPKLVTEKENHNLLVKHTVILERIFGTFSKQKVVTQTKCRRKLRTKLDNVHYFA